MFYLSLALRLGIPVRKLLRTHTSKELTEWMAYFHLESEHMASLVKKPTVKPAVEKEDIVSNFRRLAKKKRK